MTKLIIQLCLWETLACSYSIISKFNFYDDHHISFQTYITFIWTHYLFKPAPIAQDTGWGEGNISSPKGEIILKRLSWPMDHKWTLQQHSSHIHSHTLMYTKHLQAHTNLSSQIDAEGRGERERVEGRVQLRSLMHIRRSLCGTKAALRRGVCLSACMALGQTCQNSYVNDANDVNDAREAVHCIHYILGFSRRQMDRYKWSRSLYEMSTNVKVTFNGAKRTLAT